MFPTRGAAQRDDSALSIDQLFESKVFSASGSGTYVSTIPAGDGGLEVVKIQSISTNGRDTVYFKGAWYRINSSLGDIVKSTDDGLNWTSVYNFLAVDGISPNQIKLACTDDYICVVGKVSSSTNGVVKKSSDGTTWTSVTAPSWAAADAILAFAGGSGYFYLAYYNATTKTNHKSMVDTGTSLASGPGTTTDTSIDIYKVTGGRHFYSGNDTDRSTAVGGATNNLVTATNGDDVIYDPVNSKYIYLSGTTVLTSTDGYTFSATTSLPSACRALEISGNDVVALGQLGDYKTSNAGTTWTLIGSMHNIDPNPDYIASSGSKILSSLAVDSATALLDPAAVSLGNIMTMIRQRDTDALSQSYPTINDSRRGPNRRLRADTNIAQTIDSTGITSFTSIGALSEFTAGGSGGNSSTAWTIKEAPRFFQIIEYNGNNAAGRVIPHNLGIAPGFIIIKCVDVASTNWVCWHRSGYAFNLVSNGTLTLASHFGTMTATDIVINASGTTDNINSNSRSYVMYVFAHDSNPDGLIYCGDYSGSASALGTYTNIGWEPQFVATKCVGGIGTTYLSFFDDKRGMSRTLGPMSPFPDIGDESLAVAYMEAQAEGFRPMGTANNVNASAGYVFVAIRRYMLDTDIATEVMSLAARTGSGAGTTVGSVGYPDIVFTKNRGAAAGFQIQERVNGPGNYLLTSTTAAIGSDSNRITEFGPNYFKTGGDSTTDTSGATYIHIAMKRAKGVYDQFQYDGGGGAGATRKHQLEDIPGMVWVKRLDAVGAWRVYYGDATKYLDLSTNAAAVSDSTIWNNTAPTSTNIVLGSDATVNAGSARYLAMLFGTRSGVSKVSTYAGAGVGTIKQIDCGFVAGARLVMIKRIDSTGDWYMWDTTRGIVAGNDPYFLLNSTAAEVTSTDYLDPYSAGFELSVNAPSALNDIAGTYLYWAVA